MSVIPVVTPGYQVLRPISVEDKNRGSANLVLSTPSKQKRSGARDEISPGACEGRWFTLASTFSWGGLASHAPACLRHSYRHFNACARRHGCQHSANAAATTATIAVAIAISTEVTQGPQVTSPEISIKGTLPWEPLPIQFCVTGRANSSSKLHVYYGFMPLF
ncbi:Protein of unknown function [Gryllus bimaculatus]|nr:Protein of unknown function [Gryllus bimaculatus]